jgi:hypothetical protein
VLPEPCGLRLSAVFDDGDRHRYQLRAEWEGEGRGTVMFCMLNPGSAKPGELGDPTVKKTIGYARRWGYASVVLGNLFTFRTPEPAELLKAPDPCGPLANSWLHRIASDPSVELVVVAWGQHAPQYRVAEALKLLAEAGHPRVFCLGTTKDGSPCHPGRIAYSTPLVLWTPR